MTTNADVGQVSVETFAQATANAKAGQVSVDAYATTPTVTNAKSGQVNVDAYTTQPTITNAKFGQCFVEAWGQMAIGAARCTGAHSFGKFYFEVSTIGTVGAQSGFGLTQTTQDLNQLHILAPNSIIYYPDTTYQYGGLWLNNVNQNQYYAGATAWAVAVDLNNNLFWMRELPTGYWNGGRITDPSQGTYGIDISSIATNPLVPVAILSSATSLNEWQFNFGQNEFSGEVPAGFYSGWPLNIVN